MDVICQVDFGGNYIEVQVINSTGQGGSGEKRTDDDFELH